MSWILALYVSYWIMLQVPIDDTDAGMWIPTHNPYLCTSSISFPETITIRLGCLYHLEHVQITAEHGFTIQTYDSVRNTNYIVLERVGNSLIVANQAERILFSSCRLIPIQKHELQVQYGDLPFRRIPGELEIDSDGTQIILLMHASPETYLVGVLYHETANFQPPCYPFLIAHSIVSRSYMIAALNAAKETEQGYSFCDTTSSQVFKGIDQIPRPYSQAVNTTRGIYLGTSSDDPTPLMTFYASCCGGQTIDGSRVFSALAENMLPVVSDQFNNHAFCSASPHYRWRKQIPEQTLLRIFFPNTSSSNSRLEISPYYKQGDQYVDRIQLTYANQTHSYNGETFRILIGRHLGFNILYSAQFMVERQGLDFIFTGRGMGHGVGMCQWGAFEMARQGYTPEQIVYHYFPKATLYRQEQQNPS